MYSHPQCLDSLDPNPLKTYTYCEVYVSDVCVFCSPKPTVLVWTQPHKKAWGHQKITLQIQADFSFSSLKIFPSLCVLYFLFFREEKSFYTLRAQVVDIHTGLALEPESEFIIKVQDINDNEPRFRDGPYSGSVPEMSPTGKKAASGWEERWTEYTKPF